MIIKVKLKFEKWQMGYKELHNKVGFLTAIDCYDNFFIDLEDDGRCVCVSKQNFKILNSNPFNLKPMLNQTIDLKNKKGFPFIHFFYGRSNDRFYLDFNDLLLFLKNRNVDSEVIAELANRGESAYNSLMKEAEEIDKKIKETEKEIK